MAPCIEYWQIRILNNTKQHASIHLTKKEFADGSIRTSNGIEYSDYGQFAQKTRTNLSAIADLLCKI